MTVPRRVFLGTFLVTRRCVQRRFLLRPEKALDDGFLYVFLVGAKKFAIAIHGLVVLSNHYHLVATPTRRNLPRFVHWIHLHMAKLVNVRRRRSGAVWSSVDKTSVVHLADADAVLRELVYTAVNPVEAGLVPTPAEWPGVRTLPAQVGTTLVAERPAFYFRSEADAAGEAASDGEGGEGGEGARRGARGAAVLPARIEVELTRPPQFAGLTDPEFRALFARAVDESVAGIHAARQAAGRPGFLGVWGVLAQEPESTPGGPGTPDFSLSPTVACRDKWRRIELLQQRAEFLAEYRVAWGAFREGNRNVRFPEGTYGPCVLYGARCHGNPPEHAAAGSRVRLAA